MLTAASQYLQPDYLQPISMTLDAKNSPLALLAQTCNSIGKDPTPPKSSLNIGDKKEKATEKPHEPSKISSPIKEKENIEKELFKLSQRPNKGISPSASTVQSGNSSSSPARSSSGSPRSVISNNSPKPPTVNKSSISPSSHRPSPVLSHRPHSRGSTDDAPSRTAGIATSAISSPISSASISNSLKPNPHVGLPVGSALPYPIPYMGLNHEHHLQTSAYPAHIPMSYPTSLPQVHAGHVASGLKPHSSILQDITYTRVRNSSGSTSIVPVCKDPYCSNCQLTVQNSHLSSTCNTAGCTQCAHEKYLTGLIGGLNGAHLGAYPGLHGALPHGALPSALPGLPDSRLSAALPSLYPHGALGAHSGLPYICNWMSGSEYCGKRFGSSEELLQHLKTHTTAMDHAALINYQMGLPGLAVPGAYPTPGSLSPTSLRKSYPSLGALDLAANRYHPYRHLLANNGASHISAQMPQSLAPYYSPYALYGHRLGTTGLL